MCAGTSPPTLRLYRWSERALTIGYGQDRDRDVDCAACRARGIAVIRRVTGGRAVLHDAEVTYSVSAPKGLPGFGSGLDEAYRRIAAGLSAGLRKLGVGVDGAAPAPAPAPVTPASRGPRHAGCFASRARHEIGVGGRKIVGSAQRREAGGFLQHGSILLASHAPALAQVLRGGPVHGDAAMAGLAEVLPAPPTPEAVAAAVVAGCAAAWDVRFEPAGPSLAEVREARSLERGRYRSEGWNAGRRPGAAPR